MLTDIVNQVNFVAELRRVLFSFICQLANFHKKIESCRFGRVVKFVNNSTLWEVKFKACLF